ncbi:acyl-CoA dehydrogenase, N-terminal domain protein [Mycobacterium ulcerans str. Harvey]|uniref:Acyl-CoA dehydrogenase, N-terminal domain protein n=1 Tax=Mycobacterium ulcerans str. Harvey TaxID=1299332 RepID=A0ABP3AFV0_MYCUL|nr:acyl-CoA dehydrogenase, N-terminal domain protein [Mycobacterium ulcerans str. Harvey]
MLVPESLGGAGASAREAAVVMEEVGRAVAPVPFLSSAVLATVALLHSGETETLSELVQGELTAALVVPLATAPGDPLPGESWQRWVVGRVCGVAGAGRPTCWWCRSPGRRSGTAYGARQCARRRDSAVAGLR